MNNSAFTFQTLHPDTIMDALFEHGIRVDSGLTPLNSYENRVYQFQDEDRRRFVVKFYRPERWTADQILEEHQFALQLVNDEVPVAAPVAFNGQTLLNHQGFYFAVFPSVGGAIIGTIHIGDKLCFCCLFYCSFFIDTPKSTPISFSAPEIWLLFIQHIRR